MTEFGQLLAHITPIIYIADSYTISKTYLQILWDENWSFIDNRLVIFVHLPAITLTFTRILIEFGQLVPHILPRSAFWTTIPFQKHIFQYEVR